MGIGTVASVVGILAAVGLAPNLPRIYRWGKARLDAPRQRQRDLEQKVDGLAGLVQQLVDIGHQEQRAFSGFQHSTIEDVRELKEQVDVLASSLQQVRTQIQGLNSADDKLLSLSDKQLKHMGDTLTLFRESVDDLNAKVAALRQQLDKVEHEGQVTSLIVEALGPGVSEMHSRLEHRVQALEGDQDNLGVVGEAVRVAPQPADAPSER